MPDTFDSDPNTLPTVTKALRQAWTTAAPGGHIDAVATTFSMRAALDAIRALEDRVIALGG